MGPKVSEEKKDKEAEGLNLSRSLVLAKEIGDQQGIEDAFRNIVFKYQTSLFGIIYSYVKDTYEAEDVLQEVFMKVFKKIETFREASSFFSWLFRVAVNTANDHLDKKKRRPRALFEDLRAGDGEGGVERALVSDNRFGNGTEDPVSELQKRDAFSIVRYTLRGMKEPFKSTLLLREFEGLSYQEIADAMGCSIGTVESRLFRARKKFKELILELGPDVVGLVEK